ncbi:MAG TPA: LysR family transcriptional regulator [Aldersonia sp.]
MLNTERLRALIAVAEHGSIAAAAQSLHVTASGVSQQLSKLEREIGVTLLVPAGRGVALTDAGRLLAQRGERILSELAEVEAEVVSLDRDVVGELRIGSFTSPGRVVIPPTIASLRERYPRLEVSFVVGETDDLLPAVVARDLDVALVDSWITMPVHLPAGIRHTLVHRDAVHVALPATHPLAGRTYVGIDEVADMSWSTWDKRTVFHAWLVQTLRREGIEPRVQYVVPEFAAQLEFVAHGLAAAMVPELARVWVPPTVVLLPTRPRIEREIYALCRADNNRPAVRVGIDTLQQTFAAMHP